MYALPACILGLMEADNLIGKPAGDSRVQETELHGKQGDDSAELTYRQPMGHEAHEGWNLSRDREQM